MRRSRLQSREKSRKPGVRVEHICGHSWSHNLHLLAQRPPEWILIRPLPLGITHSWVTALINSIWLAEHGPCVHEHGCPTPFPFHMGGKAFPSTYPPNRKSIWILGDPRRQMSTVYILDLQYFIWLPQQPWEGGIFPFLPTGKLRLRESNYLATLVLETERSSFCYSEPPVCGSML